MLHRVADNALLCFDDDGAGHKATIKAAQLLLAEGMPIRVLALPDGDDPDSYILKHGKDSFADLINKKAESIVQFQIRASRTAEKNPNDPNASVRITKSVLETVSKSKDKVYRTILLKEAAKSLGIDFSTLSEEANKSVTDEQKASEESAEQLIEPMVGGMADVSNNPPTTTEGALINYLMTGKPDKSVVSCIEKLIPVDILLSHTTKSILKSFLLGDSLLRESVEGMSTDEYRTFISIMATFDGSLFPSVSDKTRFSISQGNCGMNIFLGNSGRRGKTARMPAFWLKQ